MKPLIEVHRLGRIPYSKALGIQHALFDKLRLNQASAQNTLLLLEHEPVYTVGIRSQQYNQDYVDKLKDKLGQLKLKAEFVSTNRGGLITFHGPGQLVAYPIIQLGDFSKAVPNKSVKAYVKRLEETVIETLARVGVPGAHTVHEYPGVWLEGGDRKIAFVGITCKRYVTMHGVSINCDCDLTWFEHIVSCGIEGKAITSVRKEVLAGRPMVASDSITDRGCSVDDLPGKTSPDNDASSAVNGRIAKSDDPMTEDRGEPRFGVRHVADAFCSSFLQQFRCESLER